MARFLTGRPVRLTHKFLDEETVLNPASVTVTITPRSGGPAQTETATKSGDLWTATFAALPRGEYDVLWNGGAVAQDNGVFEVTGNVLFTLPEARASDKELRDKTEYPADEIAHYREVIEYEFEKITNRSFVPRRKTFTFDAPGADAVWLGVHDPIALVAISGPEGPLALSDYRLDRDGVLSGLDGLVAGDPITVTVDYGMTNPPPDVVRAALIRLRYLLASESSGIPDRATMFQAANGGMFYLATAGRSGFQTGIPEVDYVLGQYTYHALYGVMSIF